MANSKVTALSEVTNPALTSLIYVVSDPGGTPTSQKCTLTNLQTAIGGGFDPTGWINPSETWTYASGTVFTVPTDLTAKYTAGVKIKLTQTTTKYFYVTSSSYNAPNTIVNVTGGTDYTLANAAITNNYYSRTQSPQGFPDWFNYTPILTASVTNPTLGNSTLVGAFRMDGRTITVAVHFQVGSTFSVGDGNYRWSLPYQPVFKVSNTLPYAGSIRWLDAGVAHYVGVTQIITASSIDYLVWFNNNSGNYSSNNAPVVWATGDIMDMQITYGI